MAFHQNLRYAVRMMGKRPMFTAAIVLTLGICIGALTAVFSIVDATLLRPLPYPEPERLAFPVIRSEFEGRTGLQYGQDGAGWEHLRDSINLMDLAVYSNSYQDLNFSAGNQVAYISQQRIGAGYFRVLGVPPVIGREFTLQEDVPNGPAVVILSHAFWVRVFQSNRSVVGQTVNIAGLAYEVVGVAAPSFESDADLWTPLRPAQTGEGVGINYLVIGRLQSGVSWAQAESEMASVGQALIQKRRFRAGVTAQYGLMNPKELTTGSLQLPLMLVFGATMLVLVIGCVNIAGMLLARGASRGSEIATRMALGARRSAIIRQLLSEGLVLALAGGFLGIVIGYFSLDLMKSSLPESFSSLTEARLDVRVMAAMAAVSILTSLLFGLFPALQAGRVDIKAAQTGRGIVGSSGSLSRRAFSIFQIAIAVAMLIGAGLLLRSFNHLWNIDPGFDATNVTTASFALRDARYATSAQVNRYYRDVLTRLQAIQGVEAAAVTLSLPYETGLNNIFQKPGDQAGVTPRLTNVSYATPQLFQAFRIPVLRGRGITDSDGPESTPIVVVNDAFVRMHFKDEDPVGVQISIGGDVRQIAGVVGDVLQHARWGNFGLMGRVPNAYIPVAQFSRELELFHTWFSPSWVVRTAGPQLGLQRQIEEAVRAVDPLLPIASFRSIDQIKLRTLSMQRFMANLIGIAAGLALLLAVIGIYAMISNSVAERAREFGIRLALGATVAQTIRNSIRPGLWCGVIGMVLGLLLARMGTQFLQGMLYGITPVDGLTYTAVGIGVLIVAGMASVIPALRITKLDPSQTLRQE